MLNHYLAEYKGVIDRAISELHKPEYKLLLAADEALEGGKRLRPIIALLSCEAVSGSYRHALPVAIAYELAHTASLVQDDIIDESYIRHNKPTAHQKYGIVKAILVSDILIFDIFRELYFYSSISVPKKRLLLLLNQIYHAAHLAIRGEYLEMGTSIGSLDGEEYVRIAGMKTGALYAASAASGATVGGADEHIIQELYQFGLNLGIAFQIRDDILDIAGNERELGKPTLNDLRNSTCNIVIIDALSKATAKQKSSIFSFTYRRLYTKSDKDEFVALMKDLGSLDYADTLMRKFADKSRRHLSGLENNKAKAILEKLTYELQERWK